MGLEAGPSNSCKTDQDDIDDNNPSCPIYIKCLQIVPYIKIN